MSTFALSMEKVFNSSSDSQILRAQWHDYRAPGFYLITMVCNDRDAAPFGSLTGDSEDTATVRLSAVSEVLDNAILAIPNYYPEIEIVERVVMEDHCHICLQVKAPMQKHLGAVVSSVKKVTTTYLLHLLNMKECRLHLTAQKNIHEQKKQQSRLQDAISKALTMYGDTVQNEALDMNNPGSCLAEEVLMVMRRQVQCGIAASSDACNLIPITTIPPLWQETWLNDGVYTESVRDRVIGAITYYTEQVIALYGDELNKSLEFAKEKQELAKARSQKLNTLDMVDDQFTTKDYENALFQAGLSTAAAGSYLGRLVAGGLVERLARGIYKKKNN